MPTMKEKLLQFDSPTGIGLAHELMSRETMRYKRDQARNTAQKPGKSPQDVYLLLKHAETLACKLGVRNALSVITAPMDQVLGTQRGVWDGSCESEITQTRAFKQIASLDKRFSDVGLIPFFVGLTGASVAGTTSVLAGGFAMFAALPTMAIPEKAHQKIFSKIIDDKGSVDGYKMEVVGAATTGSFLAAAVATGVPAYAVARGFGNVAALPSAAIKGLGNGVGTLAGTVLSKHRALKKMRALGYTDFVPQQTRAQGIESGSPT